MRWYNIDEFFDEVYRHVPHSVLPLGQAFMEDWEAVGEQCCIIDVLQFPRVKLHVRWELLTHVPTALSTAERTGLTNWAVERASSKLGYQLGYGYGRSQEGYVFSARKANDFRIKIQDGHPDHMESFAYWAMLMNFYNPLLSNHARFMNVLDRLHFATRQSLAPIVRDIIAMRRVF